MLKFCRLFSEKVESKLKLRTAHHPNNSRFMTNMIFKSPKGGQNRIICE